MCDGEALDVEGKPKDDTPDRDETEVAEADLERADDSDGGSVGCDERDGVERVIE